MLARSCADERGRDTGTLPPDPIRQTSRALIAAAKKAGCFVDVAKVPGTRYTIRTGESEVRLVQREQVYYKIKDPFAKLHLKKHPPEYVLFEHVVHNISSSLIVDLSSLAWQKISMRHVLSFGRKRFAQMFVLMTIRFQNIFAVLDCVRKDDMRSAMNMSL